MRFFLVLALAASAAHAAIGPLDMVCLTKCAIKAVGNNATANEQCAELEGDAQISCICKSSELMNTLEPCVKSDCDDDVWEELRDECDDAEGGNGGTGGAGALSVSALLASGVAGLAIAAL